MRAIEPAQPLGGACGRRPTAGGRGRFDVGMDADQAEAVAALLRRGVLADDDAGPSLADVRRARVPLSDGEAATVAIPVAEALDAVHDAGLAYGPPGPGDVRFLPGGRPALVAPPGWADDAGDDVPGLLRTVLAMMTPAMPPPADDEVADDEPDLRLALEELLAHGCRSGAEVVRACFGTVEPEPIRMPDAGALARAALLDPPGASMDAPVPMRPQRLPRGGQSAPSRREVRRRARRRLRLRVGGGVLVALAVVVGGVLLRPAAGRADAGQIASPAAVLANPVLDREAPAAAAAALTRQRAAVVGAGDAAGLAAVDAAGGPALDADEDLLASLDGDRLEGLSVDVQSAALVGHPGQDEALVAVTSAMSPYRRIGPSGAVAVPGTAPRTVALTLRWGDGGWRVWSVAEPTATP
jgi:hypothetical protein